MRDRNSGIVNGQLQQLRLHSSIIPTFHFSIAPFFHHSILPTFLYSIFLGMAISAAAHGQVRPLSDPYSVRCPPPADPHYLYFECVGRPFDFIEETMTKDWG